MLFHLNGKKAAEGYKRKKLKLNTSLMNSTPTVPSDMEIEDFSGNFLSFSPIIYIPFHKK